jgi:phage shock protein A
MSLSLFSKISVVARAHANEVVDKVVDMNSIPVVTQYIRDLETNLGDMKHQAAVAAANVTTISNQQTGLLNTIATDKLKAKAFKDQGNEPAARAVIDTIVNLQAQADALTPQIETAREASQHLDAAVAQVQTRHDSMVQQLRTLQTQDRTAHALEGATKSMAAAAGVVANLDSSQSVDNLANRIQARSDVATEEFNRTVAEFAPAEPADPLKKAAADSIFNSL